ncbi:MAG: primosomal protein N' [Candidatus Neomarinimicrobiota bacterium]|nr:primosomal protein N' [Candidatus Neomarinimicrobiota bacterium]
MYADIAFPISSYQVFTYRIPYKMRNSVKIGVRVKAPFHNRSVNGVVVGVSDTTDYKRRVRSIDSLVDNELVLDKYLWSLLEWVSEYYLTPLGQVAQTALPAKLSLKYKPPSRIMISFRKDPDVALTNAPAQERVLRYLQQNKGPVNLSVLKDITLAPSSVCKALLNKGLITWEEQDLLPDVSGLTFSPIHKKVKFTKEQKLVLEELRQGLNSKKFIPFLLHGVTSSGKTEIYIDIVRQTLESGRSVILLLPEIALTPQITGRFQAVFGETVALWHSKLTHATRSWTWKKICAGEFRIVIGARSAIFTPLKNLGLVVVDEEQEHSYKQDSINPRYHARDVALMRGKIHKIPVLLASATPSLESYYNHIQSKFRYLYLPKRYGGAKYPQVSIVDMDQETEESGKTGQILSGFLLDKIEERLQKKEQVILMQNRRGFSPIIRCGDCGVLDMCPDCNVPMAYHRTGSALKCHFCGHSIDKLSANCGSCKSTNIKMVGTGTQKIETIMGETFPNASIVRVDMDTSRNMRALTSAISSFGSGDVDILLGTQMISKGLDFENATLVGIINADTGLFLPDFRSGERLFQLIYQTAGRAGRSKKPGEVVIQTYNYDNPVIKYASRLDLKKYYSIILNERNDLNYPPFSWMAKLELSGRNKNKLQIIAQKLRDNLKKPYSGLEILGPADCYYERLRNRFRMQIVLKSYKTADSNGRKLHNYIKKNFPDGNYLINSGVKTTIDINPVSLL